MAFVKECPKNLTDVQEASKRLNCDVDIYGNNRYLCLPNTEKTSLVEFCYNGTMGMQHKGNCLEASDGSLHLEDCKHFAFGCPEMHFRSTAFYEYPACQTIDTKRQCYMLDTSCSTPDIKNRDDTEERICSLFIWQLLLSFSLVIIIILLVIVWRLVMKTCKAKETYSHLKETYETFPKTDAKQKCIYLKETYETFPKTDDTLIYTIDRRENGIQDSSRKSPTIYTYPLSRDGKDARGTNIFPRGKNEDCFPSEFHGQYSLRK